MQVGRRAAYVVRGGIGQLTPTQPLPAPAPATSATDPLWARLAAAFGTPLTQALSTRIAYGSAAPYMTGGYYYPYGSTFSQGGMFGTMGISPSTLLLGAVAIGAVMLLKR